MYGKNTSSAPVEPITLVLVTSVTVMNPMTPMPIDRKANLAREKLGHVWEILCDSFCMNGSRARIPDTPLIVSSRRTTVNVAGSNPSWVLPSPLRRSCNFFFSPLSPIVTWAMPQTNNTTVTAARMGRIMVCISHSFQRSAGHFDLAALEQIRRQRYPTMLDTLGALRSDAAGNEIAGRVSVAVHSGRLVGEQIVTLNIFPFHAGDFRHAGHFS